MCLIHQLSLLVLLGTEFIAHGLLTVYMSVQVTEAKNGR